MNYEHIIGIIFLILSAIFNFFINYSDCELKITQKICF